jgi:hypothetical protein
MAEIQGIAKGQVDILDSGGIEVAMQPIPHQVAQHPPPTHQSEGAQARAALSTLIIQGQARTTARSWSARS